MPIPGMPSKQTIEYFIKAANDNHRAYRAAADLAPPSNYTSPLMVGVLSKAWLVTGPPEEDQDDRMMRRMVRSGEAVEIDLTAWKAAQHPWAAT
jgi:hypothetical protein